MTRFIRYLLLKSDDWLLVMYIPSGYLVLTSHAPLMCNWSLFMNAFSEMVFEPETDDTIKIWSGFMHFMIFISKLEWLCI